MSETVLITGGSGFIGIELAQSLMAKGDRIVIFDLKPPRRLMADKSLTFVQGDMTNFPQVLNAVREHRPHGIVHLAALLSEPSEQNPWASISVNGLGTYHILEAARLFDVRKLLISSSMAVYINPRLETDTVTESTPQRPPLIYGITKVFSELLALYYHRKFGLDTRGIRLPVLVGPNVESPGFGQFNSLLIQSAILGKPYQVNVPEDTVIPLLYVKDAVRSLAMLYHAEGERLITRIYNIGQIVPAPSTADIIRTVKQFYPDARFSFTADSAATEVAQSTPKEIRCDEAQKEWGWFVKYSLEDTVKDFIATLEKSGGA
jgi:nucleoside-diphosphate-sugar epimerase